MASWRTAEARGGGDWTSQRGIIGATLARMVDAGRLTASEADAVWAGLADRPADSAAVLSITAVVSEPVARAKLETVILAAIQAARAEDQRRADVLTDTAQAVAGDTQTAGVGIVLALALALGVALLKGK